MGSFVLEPISFEKQLTYSCNLVEIYLIYLFMINLIVCYALKRIFAQLVCQFRSCLLVPIRTVRTQRLTTAAATTSPLAINLCENTTAYNFLLLIYILLDVGQFGIHSEWKREILSVEHIHTTDSKSVSLFVFDIIQQEI